MGHRSAVFLLLFISAPLLRGGEVPDVSAMDILDNTRIIKAEDLLSLHIIKASKEPQIITVNSTGEVKHLVLSSPMPAAGLTCRTLAFNIRRQLERDYLAGTQIVLVKFASSMDVLDDRHIFVPGDTVSIRVLEDRRDADQRRVGDDGMLEVRHLGAVKAGGMTCRKLATLLTQKLVTMPPSKLPPYAYPKAPTVLVAFDRMTCGFPSMDELDNNIKLWPGWTIGIRILEDRREMLQQLIAVSGEVQVRYIGLVKAAGLTCAELAAKVKAELEKDFFPHATVIVNLDPREKVERTIGCFPSKPAVSALGNVAKPGKYDLPEEKELTVSGFLSIAGGLTSKKRGPTIRIIRSTPLGTKIIWVYAHAVLVEKSKAHDLFLRPDDVMFVD